MKRQFATALSLVAVALVLSVQAPAHAATPTPTNTAVAAVLTAAVATQTAAVTRTTGAATVTAVAATTAAAASTPTPNPAGRAAVRRNLNDNSPSWGPKLGELWKALWNSRQTGGALTVATPGPVYDLSAVTAGVQGVYVSKGALTAQVITACGNTGATTFLKCALCLSSASAGTYTWRPGIGAPTQETAVKPPCAHNETEIGWLELPPSFTSNTSTITAYLYKQSPTLASSTAVFGEQ